MDLKWLEAITEFVGSLTFGGMLGGGLAALFYSLIISSILPSVPFEIFLLSGILLGSALHKPVDMFWKLFLSPIAKLGKTEIQLQKLNHYQSRGLINKKQYLKMAEKIIEKDILDD
jgi:hypothetical protein